MVINHESATSSAKQLSRQVEELKIGSNPTLSGHTEHNSKPIGKMFSQLTPVQKLVLKQGQLNRIEEQAFTRKDDLPERLKLGIKKIKYKKKILL